MKEYVLNKGVKSKGINGITTDNEVAKPLVAAMHKMHRAHIANYYTMLTAPKGKTNLRSTYKLSVSEA